METWNVKGYFTNRETIAIENRVKYPRKPLSVTKKFRLKTNVPAVFIAKYIIDARSVKLGSFLQILGNETSKEAMKAITTPKPSPRQHKIQ